MLLSKFRQIFNFIFAKGRYCHKFRGILPPKFWWNSNLKLLLNLTPPLPIFGVPLPIKAKNSSGIGHLQPFLFCGNIHRHKWQNGPFGLYLIWSILNNKSTHAKKEIIWNYKIFCITFFFVYFFFEYTTITVTLRKIRVN